MTANTRLKIGIALAVGGNVAFFTSAWIAWMPWSAATKATLWGILFFTPEVCTLAAVAIMGRENYERFKEVVFKWLGRIKPEGDIGEWRHRIGLVMFFVPLVPTYIQAYKPEWLPDSSAWRWIVKVAADLIFIASFFVLGGDFWDKLHALFVRDARVPRAPEDNALTPNAPPHGNQAARWLESVNTPEFAVPDSWSGWLSKRSEIRATLWNLLGDLPPRPEMPVVKILSREEGDGFVLEKFEFDNGAGATVPGYLFLPKFASAKVPAILYCHWHGGQYDVGKEEMKLSNATPVAAGPALAKLGYAVLGIDAYGFGEREGLVPGGTNEKGREGETAAAKFQLWAGRSLWGMMVRDDLMALDYLCSRPEVDANRIGATGTSMGSTRAWWIMALDDRPKAAVCVACLTRYQDLIRAGNLRAHGIYYFVPGMLRHFDSEAVIACATPRAMLFMTGDRDEGSPAEGVKTIAGKVSPLYQLAGRESNFESIIYPDTGHVYLPGMWERTVQWMEKHLKD